MAKNPKIKYANIKMHLKLILIELLVHIEFFELRFQFPSIWLLLVQQEQHNFSLFRFQSDLLYIISVNYYTHHSPNLAHSYMLLTV